MFYENKIMILYFEFIVYFFCFNLFALVILTYILTLYTIYSFIKIDRLSLSQILKEFYGVYLFIYF